MLFESLPHLCNIEVGVSQCCLIHCHICVILRWVYLNVV